MSSFWRGKCNESDFFLKHDKKKIDQLVLKTQILVIFYLVISWVLR